MSRSASRIHITIEFDRDAQDTSKEQVLKDFLRGQFTVKELQNLQDEIGTVFKVEEFQQQD